MVAVRLRNDDEFLRHISDDGNPHNYHLENIKYAKLNDSLCLLNGETEARHWSRKMKWVSFLYICKLELLKRSKIVLPVIVKSIASQKFVI
jgi:hypothetical protein